MTTPEQIHPFENNYWNLIQSLAWVHLRKDEIVNLADDDVTEWGTYKEEVITPDGEKKLVTLPNGRPTVLLIELYGCWDGAIFNSVTEASKALIKELQLGNIVCLGVANNVGDLQEIPKIVWADLQFWYEPDIAAPKGFMLRQNTTRWHNLKFKRKEILQIWSELSVNVQSKREIQKLNTLERNKKIQTSMEELAKEKNAKGETFNKGSLANDLYKKGEFSGIDSETIARVARKTW